MKHFDGKKYFNPYPATMKRDAKDILRWIQERKLQKWRNRKLISTVLPPKEVTNGKMLVTWIGHATLLLQFDGVNILTDPIWSKRCSPSQLIGPKRFVPPGIKFSNLPPIHAVIVSHNHYDHMDYRTLKRLHIKHDPYFFVPMGLKTWFDRQGIKKVSELDWWESSAFLGMRFHCAPSCHFSSRNITDRNKTLWASWVVEGTSGRFFFAGDTGYSPQFLEIGQRFAPIRLAAIPIGAYLPRWFMKPVHIDPKEALQIHIDLGAEQSIAIHFGTFRLTDDGQDDPPNLLKASLQEFSVSEEKFWILSHGETRDVAPVG
ncbi:MAG: MBL fold metallo-hydrolase [Desulfobacterales bacterium]|nr:MBL fold metallo-hydrolase [Desulfobacterales bacterium]